MTIESFKLKRVQNYKKTIVKNHLIAYFSLLQIYVLQKANHQSSLNKADILCLYFSLRVSELLALALKLSMSMIS